MKFGQRLGDEAVGEWVTKYINYQHLKKLIAAFPAYNKETIEAELLEGEISPQEKKFLSALSIEVDKAAKFFFDELREIRIRKEDTMKQLDVLHRMEEQEGLNTGQDMVFDDGGSSKAGSSKFGPMVSFSATKLLRRYSTQVMSTTTSELDNDNVSDDNGGSTKYSTKSATPNLEYPIDQPAPLFARSKSQTTPSIRRSGSIIIREAIHRHSVRKTVATAKSHIRTAVIEVYHALELLKNFRDLNILAYQKIVKKFEKHSQRKLNERLLQEFMSTPFYRNTEISTLFQQVQDLFQLYFTNNSHHQAMQVLRSTGFENVKAKENAYINLFVGLFSGMNVMLLVNNVQLAIDPVIEHKELPGLIRLYFGFGFPLLIANLLILNLYVFDAYKVNYRLICGVHSLTSTPQYGVFVSLLFVVYLGYVNLSLSGVFMSVLTPVLQVWVCLGLILLLAGNCLKYYQGSRIWMGREVLRIVTSPFSECLFKDFFLADQLASMGPFFQSIALLLLATLNPSSDILAQDSPSFSWVIAALPMVPYYWRAMQCIRRYVDGLKRNAGCIQMINCSRYSLAIITLIAAGLQHEAITAQMGSTNFVYVVIGIRFVYSCFSYYWDIYMDWGLGHGRMNTVSGVYDGLKEEKMMIAYPFWVYYVAIVTDGIARFLWLPLALNSSFPVVTLSTIIQNDLSYALGLIELLRRFQWNFIRVEIEHVHNCEKFQVAKDVDLPFRAQDLFDAPAPVVDEEEGESSREHTTKISHNNNNNNNNRFESEEKKSEEPPLAAPKTVSINPSSTTKTAVYDRVMAFNEEDEDSSEK